MRPTTLDDTFLLEFLNDVEKMVQQEAYIIRNGRLRSYTFDYIWEGTAVVVDDHTLRLDPISAFQAGQVPCIDGLTGEEDVIVASDGVLLTFREGLFDEIGHSTYTSGHANDHDAELLAPDAYSKLYWLYLCAMIDFALGEKNQYADDYAAFNQAWQDFLHLFSVGDGQIHYMGEEERTE